MAPGLLALVTILWLSPGGTAWAQTNTGQIFNALNTVNFDLPNRIFGTANFGRLFSAKNPREMQLGLKLTF